MPALPSTDHILTSTRAYCDATGLSAVRVSELASGNPHLCKRLREGAGCTIAIYNRVLQWFADHWPSDLDWPADIPRPVPSRDASGSARVGERSRSGKRGKAA